MEVQINNGLFERVTRYAYNTGVFAIGIGLRSQNLTINDSPTFLNLGGGANDPNPSSSPPRNQPPPLGTATGTNPNMQTWNGVDLPNNEGYGAGH